MSGRAEAEPRVLQDFYSTTLHHKPVSLPRLMFRKTIHQRLKHRQRRSAIVLPSKEAAQMDSSIQTDGMPADDSPSAVVWSKPRISIRIPAQGPASPGRLDAKDSLHWMKP